MIKETDNMLEEVGDHMVSKLYLAKLAVNGD
jgi:hypothetical protein